MLEYACTTSAGHPKGHPHVLTSKAAPIASQLSVLSFLRAAHVHKCKPSGGTTRTHGYLGGEGREEGGEGGGRKGRGEEEKTNIALI